MVNKSSYQTKSRNYSQSRESRMFMKRPAMNTSGTMRSLSGFDSPCCTWLQHATKTGSWTAVINMFIRFGDILSPWGRFNFPLLFYPCLDTFLTACPQPSAMARDPQDVMTTDHMSFSLCCPSCARTASRMLQQNECALIGYEVANFVGREEFCLL
jgi:hypothetical protein